MGFLTPLLPAARRHKLRLLGENKLTGAACRLQVTNQKAFQIVNNVRKITIILVM